MKDQTRNKKRNTNTETKEQPSRHLAHRTRKEVVEKQVDYEYEQELKEFIKYGK